MDDGRGQEEYVRQPGGCLNLIVSHRPGDADKVPQRPLSKADLGAIDLSSERDSLAGIQGWARFDRRHFELEARRPALAKAKAGAQRGQADRNETGVHTPII
jgi:hypothetical protein